MNPCTGQVETFCGEYAKYRMSSEACLVEISVRSPRQSLGFVFQNKYWIKVSKKTFNLILIKASLRMSSKYSLKSSVQD